MHEETINAQNRTQSQFCKEGNQCQNQACEYDESRHKNMNEMLCRFQSRCDRSECTFKHIMERSAFLGNCTPNYKRK